MMTLISLALGAALVAGQSSQLTSQLTSQRFSQSASQLASQSASAPAAPQALEKVADIRIQGNYRTPDAEVLRLASVQVGDALPAGGETVVERRLKSSGRFDDVEVRKRWRSLESTSDIVLVILVTERPSAGGGGLLPHLGQSLTRPMVLPIFGYEDGYGLTYGAHFSPVDLLGKDTHVSIPVTWGGTRQVSAQIRRRFSSGPITLLSSTVSVNRRENPHFDTGDLRETVGARAERTLGPWLRVGAAGEWANVNFATLSERFTSWGGDVTFDTRRDPEAARNAVYLRAGWDRAAFERGTIDRYHTDARGFIGLVGQSVLALRVQRMDASGALPSYEQYLLGGAASVRGFRAGYEAGDHLLSGSAEVRVPVTSPLSFGRMGVNVFVDRGAVYQEGEQLRDAAVRTGIGGGLFFNAAVFNLNMAVARGLDRGWRVHVSSGFQF